MAVDIEEILGRELHDVASSLQVPPMPALPQQAPRSHRLRHTLLVAAVFVLVVALAVAVEALGGGSHEPSPAPPAPTPSQTDEAVGIPTGPPTTPYVLGQKLYVDGQQVPGEWTSVESGAAGWVAWRSDDTWWWGRDAEAFEIERIDANGPVISPNGRYVGEVLEGADLNGFETGVNGEGFGLSVPVDQDERVRAVTDDGRVIAQGASSAVLWLPWVDGSTKDLTQTAPDQQFLGSTPAGLVVTDGVDGTPYLADLSDSGVVMKTGDLPANDSLVVSPGGQLLAWTPPGTLGGEVTAVSEIEAQRVDGTGRVTFDAPSGWAFRVEAWAWEDDDFLVSPLIREDGSAGERLVRCSAEAGRCVLIASP